VKQLTSIIILITLFVTATFTLSWAEEKPLIKSIVIDIDGKPVKGAYIFFYDSEDTKRAVDLVSPVTDKNGFCEKAIPPGSYWVLARLKREGDFDMGPLMIEDKVSAYPLEITVATGETHDLEFTVMNLLDTIRTSTKQRTDLNRVSGRVVNGAGEPVKKVFVFANRHDKAVLMPRYFSAWTGDDGSFNIYMPEGDYYLGISSEFAPDLKYTAKTLVKVEGDLADKELVFGNEKLKVKSEK
jgi:hypothetical protein